MNNIPKSLIVYKAHLIDDVSVGDMSENDANSFVKDVLSIMGATCGGMNFFWKKEDENFVFEGWLECFKKFKIRSIVNTLLLVMDLKYKKRDEHIPKFAIDFCHFLNETRNMDVLRMDDQKSEDTLMIEHDKEGAIERNKHAGNYYMPKIKELIDKMRANRRVSNESVGA